MAAGNRVSSAAGEDVATGRHAIADGILDAGRLSGLRQARSRMACACAGGRACVVRACGAGPQRQALVHQREGSVGSRRPGLPGAGGGRHGISNYEQISRAARLD